MFWRYYESFCFYFRSRSDTLDKQRNHSKQSPTAEIRNIPLFSDSKLPQTLKVTIQSYFLKPRVNWDWNYVWCSSLWLGSGRGPCMVGDGLHSMVGTYVVPHCMVGGLDALYGSSVWSAALWWQSPTCGESPVKILPPSFFGARSVIILLYQFLVVNVFFISFRFRTLLWWRRSGNPKISPLWYDTWWQHNWQLFTPVTSQQFWSSSNVSLCWTETFRIWRQHHSRYISDNLIQWLVARLESPCGWLMVFAQHFWDVVGTYESH